MTKVEWLKDQIKYRNRDDCWIWTFGITRPKAGGENPFAAINFQGKSNRAHIVSLILDGRPRIGKSSAMRMCDESLCVNPDHLFWSGEEYRPCRKCKEVKHCSAFYKSANPDIGGGNVRSVCKDCWVDDRHERYRDKIGWTPERYRIMLYAQGGYCFICWNPIIAVNPENRLCAFRDHNHETGEPRGLLCMNCNNGIGQFKDDLDSLESAIRYLKMTKGFI